LLKHPQIDIHFWVEVRPRLSVS